MLPAVLLTRNGEIAGFLEDVSLTGASATTRGRIAVGDSVILKCEMLDILALVRWRDGDRIGLEFEEPTDPAAAVEEADTNEFERHLQNRRFFRLLAETG